MIVSLRHFLGWLVSSLSCRADLVLENMALRRQLLALHAQRPRRRWTALHKLFWVALRMCWSAWRQPLVLVTPRTCCAAQKSAVRQFHIRMYARCSDKPDRRLVIPHCRKRTPTY